MRSRVLGPWCVAIASSLPRVALASDAAEHAGAQMHGVAPPVELPEPGPGEPVGPVVPEPTEVPPPPVTTEPPPTSDPPPTSEPPPPAVVDEGTLAINLEWRAPATCPAADRVLAVAGGLLGRSLAIDPTAQLVVRADVVDEGSRFRADLDVDGPGGATRRQFDATTCETLTDAVALVVATNVDPRAVAAALDEEQPRPRTDDPSPRRRRAPLDETSMRTSGPRRVGVALSLVGGPAIGAAPRITGAIQGGLSLSYGRALVGVYGGHAFARPDDRAPSVRAALSTGGVRGCFVPTQGRVAVPLCGLVEAGAVTARDTRDDRRAAVAWAGLGAGAGIEWAPHPRFALQAGIDALAALTRPALVVRDDDDERTTHVAAPAVVRAMFGLSVRLR